MYVDGFLMAVPHANREQFIEHTRSLDAIFLEYGATRVQECWGDDVPKGKPPTSTAPYWPVRTSQSCSPGWNGRIAPPATPAWKIS